MKEMTDETAAMRPAEASEQNKVRTFPGQMRDVRLEVMRGGNARSRKHKDEWKLEVPRKHAYPF